MEIAINTNKIMCVFFIFPCFPQMYAKNLLAGILTLYELLLNRLQYKIKEH